MKYPLWILNSALFLLILIVAGFIWISREKIPRRGSIEPVEYPTVISEAPTINIERIYEMDIFDTYKRPLDPAIARPTTP